MSNFLKDLKTGQAAEDKVKDYFSAKGYKVSKNKSKDYKTLKKFDLTINNIQVEVKNDIMAQRTGNLALEFECSNKPSGISTSTSPIWIYIIGKELLIFPLKVLKFLFNQKSYSRIVSGGDKKRAKLALFKLSDLKEHATIIKIDN